MKLTEPWQLIGNSFMAAELLAELRREVSKTHPLASHEPRPIARRYDRDDVLFALEAGGWAIVHLTWRRAVEPDQSWPLTQFFDTEAELQDQIARDGAEIGAPAGWTFELEEISNGGWECRGSDRDGRQVSRQGSDPDDLRRECWEAAVWVDQERLSLRRSANAD